MALPKSYLTSTKNLRAILQAIQSAQAPEKVTGRFLENLGFSSSNDRLLIGVLRELGFIDFDGRPKERYFRYLDQTQSETVMAEAIREAYADLFSIRTDAEKLTKQDIVNKAKTLSQGSLSESVLDKFAMTFIALVGLADFSDHSRSSQGESRASQKMSSAPGPETDKSSLPNQAEDGFSGSPQSPRAKQTLGGLHYNIQIILPATRDSAIYDAIFRSLKDHLID